MTQKEAVMQRLFYSYGVRPKEVAGTLLNIPAASIRRTLRELVASGVVVKDNTGYRRA